MDHGNSCIPMPKDELQTKKSSFRISKWPGFFVLAASGEQVAAAHLSYNRTACPFPSNLTLSGETREEPIERA